MNKVLVILRQDQPGDDRLVAYLVMRVAPTAAGADATAEADAIGHEQVTQWKQVFQDSYASSQTEDWTFDLAGWKSSYTGDPIPAEEMREWVDQTVLRIRSYGPRRIWEIGCGTGLLLSRLARHVESYVGTDFSETALRRVQQMIDRSGDFGNARLLHRAADDATDVTGPFDTIILNSVLQYFPGVRLPSGRVRCSGPAARAGRPDFPGRRAQSAAA